MSARNTLSLRLLIVLASIATAGAGQRAKAAGGGEVMPASAHPLGYSLTQAAAATAQFNTGSRTPDTIPNVPFQVLYVVDAPNNTFTVNNGTHFYVPVLALDDSPPVIGDFPGDVSDQQSDAAYIFDANEIGASLQIEVDGKVTQLDASDVVGTATDPLPDGGGTHYIAAGVFLTPMSRGTHIVKVSGQITGDAWEAVVGGATDFQFTYTVIVK